MAGDVSGAGLFEVPGGPTDGAPARRGARRRSAGGLLPADAGAELALAQQAARRRHPSAGGGTTRRRVTGVGERVPDPRPSAARRPRSAR